MEYLLAFCVALGLNLVLFVPAYRFTTDVLTDLSYALSFGLVATLLFILSTGTLSHLILFLMVLVWALRLGGYLYIRIRKMKRDKRFDGVRENLYQFLRFWVLQGVSVFVILLPAIAFFAIDEVELTALSVGSLVLWAAAIGIEAIADYQKYTFISSPENNGKWIERGLWKYSRHPNYFGEILAWIGVYLFVLPELGVLTALIGAIGPLYITALILFGTGIPTVEKTADKRWGSDPAYQAYRRRTSILIPLPRRR